MPSLKRKSMPLLVETIRADDGRFDDLTPHIERMARSRRALFGIEAPVGLEGALERASNSIGEGRWKVRVLYDTEIRSVEAAPYQPKPYGSAALVDGGSISYPYKTDDRPELDELTRRARAAGILYTAALVPSDLDRFVLLSPINAMLELGEVTLDVRNILRTSYGG